MPNPNVRPSDVAPITGVIDPDAKAAATYTTGWVSMADAEQILASILVGEIDATGTVDAKLEQASDSSGTGAKDITGKAITQLTAAGTDSAKQAQINCRSSELDVANGFDHVRLSVTIGTAAADMSAIVQSLNARYAPLADVSTVDEIV